MHSHSFLFILSALGGLTIGEARTCRPEIRALSSSPTHTETHVTNPATTKSTDLDSPTTTIGPVPSTWSIISPEESSSPTESASTTESIPTTDSASTSESILPADPTSTLDAIPTTDPVPTTNPVPTTTDSVPTTDPIPTSDPVPTTDAVPTSDPIPTADTTSKTTTSEDLPAPTPENWGFDENAESISPWTVFYSSIAVAVPDGSMKHDGPYSAKLSFSASSTNYMMHPIDISKITAGVPVEISAWFYTGSTSFANGCSNYGLACFAQNSGTVLKNDFSAASSALNQWAYKSTTCTFSQNFLDEGDLQVLVGWICGAGGTGWVDSVAVNL